MRGRCRIRRTRSISPLFGVLLLVDELDAAVAELHAPSEPGGTVVTMFYNRQACITTSNALLLRHRLRSRAAVGPAPPRGLVYRRVWLPRTYHQTPESLRQAFDRFTVESLVVRNLTRDQIPLFPFDEYPAEFWSWLASHSAST
jgi:hypothetical protein